MRGLKTRRAIKVSLILCACAFKLRLRQNRLSQQHSVAREIFIAQHEGPYKCPFTGAWMHACMHACHDSRCTYVKQ